MEVPVYPNEEDGFINHEARLNDGGLLGGSLWGTKQISNRVVVIAPNLEEVLKLRTVLPECFHKCQPIALADAVVEDVRPEPCQIVYVTRDEVNIMRDEHRGRVFFLAYSIFENIEGYGGWVDLRDHYEQCKWGRRPVTHAPGCTRSFQILHGETTIAQVKADCGFK